jgi:hypothetical protein
MTDLRKQAGDDLCLFHAGPEEFETIVDVLGRTLEAAGSLIA